MQTKLLLTLFVVSFLIAYKLVPEKGPRMYSPAKKIPHKMEIHGDLRVDNYFWMRDRDTAPVLEFLKQENARTEEALAPVRQLESEIFREMRARIKEDDASVPVFERGYFYYWRYQAGQEYPLHCRKPGQLAAPEEVILDENAIAKGHSYFQVAAAETSPDQQVLAYAVDTVGRRIYDIYFKDLKSGNLLADKIEAVTPDFVWAEDNRTVFFVRQDPETLRSFQVYRYQLGSGQKPQLIFEEKDTTYNVGVSKSKTNRFIFMSSYKRDSTEFRFVEAEHPDRPFELFLPRETRHEYSLDDGGDRFFILTDWQAKNFRVMEAPYSARDKKAWKEVIAHDPQVLIENLDTYEGFLVLGERQNGLTQLKIWNRSNKASRTLKFPDPVYEVELKPLPDYKSPVVRFGYESLVQPPSVFEENMSTQERQTLKVKEVPTYQSERYESLRLWATAQDGTKIPVSVLMKKGLQRDGKNPVLLYGYGSYGLSTEAYFRSTVVSLLDRGFIYVIAHVRGGSEMGRDWYETGRLQHKMNTFTDFIAVAESLIREGYTSAEHLYAMGGSAGGLLMGAVMNLRPDLFKGIVAMVPFVDVLTTMLDESIPLTTGEYNEWGDPRKEADYKQMRAYSPYDNVTAKDYPHLMVTTGYHDSQVQYWEPAKWVAKLRELKTDKNLLLMHTELEAGHSGASGRFEALKTFAKEYAFILMLEGVKN